MPQLPSLVKNALRQNLRELGRYPAGRKLAHALGYKNGGVDFGTSGIPVPGKVAVYFGDGAEKLYQLTQWLPVLEKLPTTEPVLLVFRTASAYRAAQKQTSLPAVYARKLNDLMNLYDGNNLSLVIYVNNSRANFQSLEHPRLVHVHVNHGESDKLSMVSNKAKAYDKVFVAGPAAIERHRAMLIDFDFNKLVITGRPQLDIDFPSELESSAGRDVMYAPTWEGENEANNYTSLDLYGVEIVESLIAAGARVIYKPHPRVETSRTPSIVQAHSRIVELLTAAGSEHVISLQGNILAMFESVDALITDISSVGLDFLYLHPEKPIVLTDRRTHRDTLLRDAPIARACCVIDGNSGRLDDLLEAALNSDELAGARKDVREFYFGDLARGLSTGRFISVVSELMNERAAKLEHVRQWHA